MRDAGASAGRASRGPRNCSSLSAFTHGRFGHEGADATLPRLRAARADDPPQHLFSCRWRKRPPRSSGGRICHECGGQVIGLSQIFDAVVDCPVPIGASYLGDATTAVGHESSLLHLGEALPVQPGPAALGFSRCDELQGALRVQYTGGRVDPAKANGLLHHFRVGTPRSPGDRTPRAQPYSRSRLAVALQPGSPLVASLGVIDGVAEFSAGGMFGRRLHAEVHEASRELLARGPLPARGSLARLVVGQLVAPLRSRCQLQSAPRAVLDNVDGAPLFIGDPR